MRTLHWYIGRELARVFLLTTSILTTILAFGGTFRPLTKQGLSLVQLLRLLLDLMPAMLAYSIPLAALFAAVIVYWRLATDNEFTGARASGLSHKFLVLPALILGLAVGGIDLLLVGYVVPIFLQKTSLNLQTDVASWLLYHVGQHEPFAFGRHLVVYADDAYRLAPSAAAPPPPGIQRSIIQLRGLAAMPMKHGHPVTIVLARAANVIIEQVQPTHQMMLAVQLDRGVAYDPNTFRQIRGTINYLPPDGRPYVIGSLLANRPKYLDFGRLMRLQRDPFLYQPIAALNRKLRRLLRLQYVAAWYRRRFKPEVPLFFARPTEVVRLTSPAAVWTRNHRLLFQAAHGRRVRVAVLRGTRPAMLYESHQAALLLTNEAHGAVGAALRLTGRVRERNPRLNRRFHGGPPLVVLSALKVPAGALRDPTPGAPHVTTPAVASFLAQLHAQEEHLRRQIASELQSRASFAFSCVVLVIFGAALGIILRGRNPLAVFVVGFVPAMILVLLINTGREMVTRVGGSDAPGLALIWAGNGLILLLNVLVYRRLLRY